MRVNGTAPEMQQNAGLVIDRSNDTSARTSTYTSTRQDAIACDAQVTRVDYHSGSLKTAIPASGRCMTSMYVARRYSDDSPHGMRKFVKLADNLPQHSFATTMTVAVYIRYVMCACRDVALNAKVEHKTIGSTHTSRDGRNPQRSRLRVDFFGDAILQPL